MKRESRSDERRQKSNGWCEWLKEKQRQDAERERQRSEAMESAKMELTGRDDETETNREKMDGF